MDYKQHLKSLVQIPSASGEESELADHLLNRYIDWDLPVEMWGDNVVVHFQNNSDCAIILNVHMDTVSAGNPNRWEHPPVGEDAGVVKDGNLYGLGASDAKASIAAFSGVAEKLKDWTPGVDVFISLVTREELDGQGSRDFLSIFQKSHAGNYNNIAAIIGEPTGLNMIEIGHRGTAYLKTTSRGNTGHASRPEAIDNRAIEKALSVVESIQSLQESIIPEHRHDNLGDPSFSLTGMNSSVSSPNQFPGECSTTWDIRTTPSLHDSLHSLLEEHLSDCEFEFIEKLSPPGYTSPDAEIVSIFEKTLPELDVKVARGASDLCFFSQASIPAVTFGPGLKEVIHRENEYVPLENIEKGAEIYTKIIEKYAAL